MWLGRLSDVFPGAPVGRGCWDSFLGLSVRDAGHERRGRVMSVRQWADRAVSMLVVVVLVASGLAAVSVVSGAGVAPAAAVPGPVSVVPTAVSLEADRMVFAVGEQVTLTATPDQDDCEHRGSHVREPDRPSHRRAGCGSQWPDTSWTRSAETLGTWGQRVRRHVNWQCDRTERTGSSGAGRYSQRSKQAHRGTGSCDEHLGLTGSRCSLWQ